MKISMDLITDRLMCLLHAAAAAARAAAASSSQQQLQGVVVVSRGRRRACAVCIVADTSRWANNESSEVCGHVLPVRL